MFTFLHAADLHLDSPLRGLERYEGAPVEQIRGATRQALERLTGLALQERVAFVLVVGDLFDGDWKDYNTGLFLSRQLSLLREAGIGVFIVSGNHDAASRLTRGLRMPDNVKVLSTHAPQTIMLDDLGVALHGQGFAEQACAKDLAATYPSCLSGYFNIGLLHTSVSGREGHEPYAPCTFDTLRSKEYDYWALGHVHQREVLSEDPWIVFPGNTQGRHIRETGPKGCTLVTVADGSCGTVEHRNLHVLRWVQCAVEATGVTHADDLVDRIREAVSKEAQESQNDFLALRLHVRGRCRAHKEVSADPVKWTNEIRAQVADATGGDVWLEKIAFQTALELDLNRALARTDPIGDLLRSVHTLQAGDALEQLVQEELAPLTAKLPSELLRGEDAIALPGAMTPALLEGVKQLLIARLIDAEGER